MKKANTKKEDELRPEYKRTDFGVLVRGKYAARAAQSSNVVLLDPQLAQAFPNDKAVNSALRAVLLERKRAARPTTRSTRTRAKAARAG